MSLKEATHLGPVCRCDRGYYVSCRAAQRAALASQACASENRAAGGLDRAECAAACALACLLAAQRYRPPRACLRTLRLQGEGCDSKQQANICYKQCSGAARGGRAEGALAAGKQLAQPHTLSPAQLLVAEQA